MKNIPLLITTIILALVSSVSFAGMEGSYKSEASCTLTVEKLAGKAGYADGKYSLRSDGTGACEWTGLGIGKRFKIEAGMASQSSTGFIEANWVFGPEGDKVEINFFDTDGSMAHKEVFQRESKDSVAQK